MSGAFTSAKNIGRREIAAYAAVSVVALLAVAVPAAASAGDWGPVMAWVLAFLPGAAIISQAYRLGDPGQSMLLMFFSTVLRVAAVIGGGFLVLRLIPGVSRDSFPLWLAGMYAVALALEIYCLVSVNALGARAQSVSGGSALLSQVQEAGR